ASARAAQPSARIDGFLVQEMVSGIEAIVGARADPLYGPLLLVGWGGVLIELAADAALRLLPVTAHEVSTMVDGLKLARRLSGFRGQPAADRAALEAAALALGRFFLDHRAKINDIEINPLMVRANSPARDRRSKAPNPAGADTRVVAVDVRVLWREGGGGGGRRRRERNGNGFRIAGRAANPQSHAAALRRQRADPDRAGDYRRRTDQAGISRALRAPRQGARHLAARRADGIWRRRHVDPRARRGMGRALAHHRHTGARRGHYRSFRTRHSLLPPRRDEGEVPAAAVARREEGLLRADRARRRLRSRQHAHHRRARRRSLPYQRRQALHHRSR